MTPSLSPEWRSILTGLEKRLQALADDGVGWLSIAGDPELATLLKNHATRSSFRASAHPSADGAEHAGQPADQTPTSQSASSGDSPPLPATSEARPSPPAPPASAAPSATPTATPSVAPPDGPSGPPASLESLRFQYRDCMECQLGSGRNRLVFGTGASKPRLMFIGEGPGADEDLEGLPFVGRAGGLLAGLIMAAGLTREDVFITNVVKCRPPGNRNPEADEIASCAPILERQIELLNPALIVVLGNVPLKNFKPGAAGITRERGRVFRYRDWPVLPTFHPSYLLRQPSAIRDCWADFRQAMEHAYPEA